MILITGASGTIGSEVVKALGPRGGHVRAGYRTRPQNVPAGVEAVALDYDRPETIRPALERVAVVFLLSNTVTPERKVVDEARRAGVRRIVKLSVLAAPDEGFVFARWHRAVEKHIEASGLAWTFLRPNGLMQNVVNYMAGTIRSRSAIYSSAGGAAVSHVDARDVGAVGAAVLAETGHEGQAYDLTGPRRSPTGRSPRSSPASSGARSGTCRSRPSRASRPRWRRAPRRPTRTRSWTRTATTPKAG